MEQTPKAIRQAKATHDAMVLKLKRLASLSMALMRADAVHNLALQAWSAVLRGDKTDAQLVDDQMEATRQLTNDNNSAAEGLLALHFGCLYAVAEKWREWGFKEPIVDHLLAHPYLETLKQYRHAVFHAEQLDAKGFVGVARNKEVLDWSEKLASAFRSVLRAYWRSVPQFPRTVTQQ